MIWVKYQFLDCQFAFKSGSHETTFHFIHFINKQNEKKIFSSNTFCFENFFLVQEIFPGQFAMEDWVDNIINGRCFVGINKLEKFVVAGMIHRDHFFTYL